LGGWAARRLGALGVVPILLLAAGAPSAVPEGRIAGTVRDVSGAPIANAAVIVVGTELSARTDRAGAYVLAKVPAGMVDIRAQFVGFRPTQIVNVIVKAGQTTRQDITLEATPVQITELTVIEANPSPVPRDEVASKQQISGGYTDRLPVTSGANGFEEASVAAGRRSRELGMAQRGHGVDWNTENYARIYDNRFLAARANPLSTFAIDVDRASYGNVRRFLQQGTRPPADAVRIEELVNYFPYDYPEPRGEHPFSVTTEVMDAPWHPGHRLVRIGLQGRRVPVAELPPSNLVFLIDVSGSMEPANKLPLVKRSLGLLVDQLRPRDRVAIVVYAGSAGLVLPSTPGTEKARIREALERLDAGGSTAGAAGIRLAYDVAREHHVEGGTNRVVLATDGDFNVGVSSDGELVRLIEERRTQGTFLTVLGFGYGNLKDGKLEGLADKGNGNYAYVDDLLEAQKVLVHEMGGTLMTIAKDVKLQVEFNPAQVRAYRLIGYENRLLAKEDFDDDTKDGGEMGAGHSVTALYEVIPVGARTDVAIAEDSLRYQQTALTETASHGDELMLVKLRYKEPEGARSRLLVHPVAADVRGSPSDDLRFAAAVSAFGMLLRDSEFKGSANWRQVLELARAGRGADRSGYRGEFLRLAELAAQLGPVAVSHPHE
jgi:Ca-activated chloride channel family protein